MTEQLTASVKPLSKQAETLPTIGEAAEENRWIKAIQLFFVLLMMAIMFLVSF